MTYNPAHILASTFLLAFLIVFGFAHFAHAETVLYDKINFTGSGVQQLPSAPTITTGSASTWDWGGFLFSSSTDGRITEIRSVIVSINGDAQVRWKIYEVTGTATSTPGTLIATTDWQTATSTSYVTSTLSPVTLKWNRDYQFILDTKEGEYVYFYQWAKTGEEPDYIYGIGCADTTTIEDCTYYGTQYSGGYNGFAWPGVVLSDGGSVGDDEYLITFAPCATDTRDNELTVCQKEFEEQPTFSWAVNTTQSDRKIELQARTTNGRLLDSVAYYYTDAGFYTGTTSLTLIGTSTQIVTEIQTCLLPADGFLGWDSTAKCTTMIFGNGTSTGSYPDWFCLKNPELEICNPEGKTMYELMNCQDVSILSVASSTYCALLWAFEPSYSSLQKFDRAKNLLLYSYPIGYFTFMWTDIQTAFTSSSTDIFTREIELGKYFGRPNTATTTLTLAGSETYIEKIKPVTDKVNILLWIGFSVWFIIWAVTRKL